MQFEEIEFELIPMSEIRDEVRKLAILWCSEMEDKNFILHRHKLASDIQNYADWYANRTIKKEKD